MLPQAHPATEPVYFARVSAGLEQLAWGDIERHTGARLLGLGHRRVDFACAAAPAGLLALRAVDDVYVRVARLRGLDHTRASLGRLTRKLGEVDFDPALALIAQVRTLPEYPMYRVTASHLGRRNYSRYDIEGAVEQALTLRLPWRFVLNAADEPMPDLDLRVLLEDDWALLGLRLGAAPLHRRDYKVAERPGALKPPVAYCLALLAGCAPGQVLLNPACVNATSRRYSTVQRSRVWRCQNLQPVPTCWASQPWLKKRATAIYSTVLSSGLPTVTAAATSSSMHAPKKVTARQFRALSLRKTSRVSA